MHCVSDAAVMSEMRMSDLMEMKSYTKLIAKQSKQLVSLRRKHEKVSVWYMFISYILPHSFIGSAL